MSFASFDKEAALNVVVNDPVIPEAASRRTAAKVSRRRVQVCTDAGAGAGATSRNVNLHRVQRTERQSKPISCHTIGKLYIKIALLSINN